MKTMIFLIMILAASVHAQADRAGNGGDPILMRQERIQTMVNTLKGKLIKYLGNFESSDISNEEVRQIFNDILERGLIEDIKLSHYEYSNDCRDNDNNIRGATAHLHDIHGPICFNISYLAENNITENELIGLAMHEHAHHFGYEDLDHSFGNYFMNDYERYLVANLLNQQLRQSGYEELFLKKSAVDFGMLNQQYVTTAWILDENSHSTPLEEIRVLLGELIERNRERNPNFTIEITDFYSEYAKIIIARDHTTSSDSSFTISFKEKEFIVPHILVRRENSFNKIGAETFYRTYREESVVLVRHVVTYRKLLTALSDEDLELAKIKLIQQFEEDSKKLASRLLKWTTARPMNHKIKLTPPRPMTQVYLNIEDLRLSFHAFKIITYNHFEMMGEQERVFYRMEDGRVRYAPPPVGHVSSEEGEFYYIDRNVYIPDIEALIDFYISEIRQMIQQYFFLAQDAYFASRGKGLNEITAKEVVRKFIFTRDSIYKTKMKVTKISGDHSEDIFIIDEAFYNLLLLPSEKK